MALSRAIAWRTAALQSSLPRRLGENDAGIAASAYRTTRFSLAAKGRLSVYLDSSTCHSRSAELTSAVDSAAAQPRVSRKFS